MSVSYQISLSGEAGEFLKNLREELQNSEGLNKILSISLAEEVREHLIDLSLDVKYHKTAQKLGAQPTGHYSKVAAALESGFSEEEAFITVPSWSGLGRAFRDVEITPKNGKKWLTIPAHKSAYGRSAREFDDLNFVFLEDKGIAALFGRDQATGEQFPMYWLVRKAKQKQDRTLLPSEEDLSALAIAVGGEWLQIVISNAGGLNS